MRSKCDHRLETVGEHDAPNCFVAGVTIADHTQVADAMLPLGFITGTGQATVSELQIKRVYDPPTPGDGYRVLVDRLWPRGISHDRAELDGWLKDIAPSSLTRTWWDHDPAQLDEFTRRYRAELDNNPAVNELKDLLREHPQITLIYAARDPVVNHAAVLRDYLLAHGDRKG